MPLKQKVLILVSTNSAGHVVWWWQAQLFSSDSGWLAVSQSGWRLLCIRARGDENHFLDNIWCWCIDALNLEITWICTFFHLGQHLKNEYCIELLEGKKEKKVDCWIIRKWLHFTWRRSDKVEWWTYDSLCAAGDGVQWLQAKFKKKSQILTVFLT